MEDCGPCRGSYGATLFNPAGSRQDQDRHGIAKHAVAVHAAPDAKSIVTDVGAAHFSYPFGIPFFWKRGAELFFQLELDLISR